MDHSADVAAMAILVEQEEIEEAANRRRGDSPPPYQQAVADEEVEEELDVTVYPQLWDRLRNTVRHLTRLVAQHASGRCVCMG